MTNGSTERLDRIERILEQVADSQQRLDGRLVQQSSNIEELIKAQGGLNRTQVEFHGAQGEFHRAQGEFHQTQVEFHRAQVELNKSIGELAARQQYHDDAFERFDAEMKVIKEAIAADAENIRALVRIAELHHHRLEHLEGGEPA